MDSASDLTSIPALPGRLPKGFVLGDYVVDGWLRDGGMAAIYRAHRSSDEGRVAIKLQLPSTAHIPEICARFDIEAEAMQRVMGSANIVQLYDAGVLDDGRRFFVMEWVEGEDLEEMLDFARNQDQRLSVERVCEIGHEIAMGLTTMHEQGLVHCDLKPANVMIGRDEAGADVVKLVDFGIVADLHSSVVKAADLQEAQGVLGTSAYMAPEQRIGMPINASVDVYALGVILYEALTGNVMPPEGWTPESLPRIESLRRGVPGEIAKLVRGSMSTDRHQRPESALLLARRLEEMVVVARAAAGSALGRAPSSEEIAIHRGGTELTPQSEIATMEASRSQILKGGTEVALTHAEVLTASREISMEEVWGEGVANAGGGGGSQPTTKPQAVAQPSPAAESQEVRQRVAKPRMAKPRMATVVMPSIQAAGAAMPAMEEKESSPQRWWIVVVLLIGVIGFGAWWLWGRAGAEEQSEGAGDQGSGSMLASRKGEDGAEHARIGEVAVEVAPEEAADGADAQQPEAEVAVAVETGAEDSTAESTDSHDAVESAEPTRKGKPRASGPSKAECEAKRVAANAAKTGRQWSAVLNATKARSCWSGSKGRLARRRLRVEAYAELGNYSRCVKEAGKSSDTQISARVGWCRKKL